MLLLLAPAAPLVNRSLHGAAGKKVIGDSYVVVLLMCCNFLYPVPFQSVITLFMSSQIICNLILKAAKDSSKIICKSKEVK